MTSLRGWFLTLTAVSLVASGNVQAQSIPGTYHVGSGPAETENQRRPAPVETVSSNAERGPVSITRSSMSMAQPAPGVMAAPMMGPGALPPGMGMSTAYGDPMLAAPPLPFPGGMSGPAGPPMGKGGCKGCSGRGCMACAGCGMCGGLGCEACGSGFVARALRRWLYALLPYSEGGRCAPRWYDITLDSLYLTREEVSRRINFASNGVNGDIVLSTDSLDFDHQLGFRLNAAVQIFAGSNLELTYFGLFNWAAGNSADRSDVGDFYSVYSNFGQAPLGGFDETDRSTFQRITYSSTLDNFELNVRKRWTGPNCKLQGSWLSGVRYLYLLEDFRYDTTGGDDLGTVGTVEINGLSDTLVTTRNSLTGFQVGGDLWMSVVPGIKVGAEGKAGVYGNYANQMTTVFASTTDPAQSSFFSETSDINDIAFVGEASLQCIYRLSPNWTFGGNFNLLYLDGVALAPENFNRFAPPNLQGATARPIVSNDNGRAFYHGFGARAEYMW